MLAARTGFPALVVRVSLDTFNLLGDLVGEDGDSEDGGQAGNGQDGSDDDGGLHALDGALDVGELSLEGGHGGSSLGFHDDSSLLVLVFRVCTRLCS